MPHIQVIGFDADDTLWINEEHCRHTEQQFVELMVPWLTERESRKELFRIEIEDLGQTRLIRPPTACSAPRKLRMIAPAH